VDDVSGPRKILGAVRVVERKIAICGQTMCPIVDIVPEDGLLWLDLREAGRIMMRTFVRVDCPEEEAACC
jgi:hypothetical protein